MQCADLSLKLENFKDAIYCYNRAAKALNADSQFYDIFEVKKHKIAVYMRKRDYISIIRTVEKQIKLFYGQIKESRLQLDTADEQGRKVSDALLWLQTVQYQTFYR